MASVIIQGFEALEAHTGTRTFAERFGNRGLKMHDARDLIERLPKSRENQKIIDNLEKLRSLWSVEFDVRRCLLGMQILQVRTSSRSAFLKGALSDQDALLDAAIANFIITTYCKCTATSSEAKRGQFDPRRFLNEEQKQAHREIVSLRNQAIAHFGPGTHPGGEWAYDRLLIEFEPTGGQFEFVGTMHRSNFRSKVMGQLSELLPIVHAAIHGAIKKREDWIGEALRARPDIIALLNSLPLVSRPYQFAEHNGPLSGTPLGGWTGIEEAPSA